MLTVLYELPAEFPSTVLTLLFLPVILFLWPWIQNKIAPGDSKRFRLPRAALITMASFATVLVLIGFLFQWNMYRKTVGAYQRGTYEIVEGYVEDFVPMPYEGHANESFQINGIPFSYSDFVITPGYRNAKSHGGVITGNGQYLRVGYIYFNETYGNIIVYIEQPVPPASAP